MGSEGKPLWRMTFVTYCCNICSIGIVVAVFKTAFPFFFSLAWFFTLLLYLVYITKVNHRFWPLLALKACLVRTLISEAVLSGGRYHTAVRAQWMLRSRYAAHIEWAVLGEGVCQNEQGSRIPRVHRWITDKESWTHHQRLW